MRGFGPACSSRAVCFVCARARAAVGWGWRCATPRGPLFFCALGTLRRCSSSIGRAVSHCARGPGALGGAQPWWCPPNSARPMLHADEGANGCCCAACSQQEVRPASNCSRLRGARRSSSELCSLPLHFRCQDYPPLPRSCPPPLRAPPSFTWISRSNPPSRRLVAASMGTAAVRLAGLGADCPRANDNALARHTHARSPAASLRGSDESQTKREQSPRRVTREREKTKT